MEVFDKTLKERGFQNSSTEHCVYVLDRGSVFKNIYLLLYVDYIVVIMKGNSIISLKIIWLKNFERKI